MCNDACSNASDEGACETSRDEMPVAKRVKCRCICAKETAPAHSHCREDGNRIAVDYAFAHHLWN